MSEQTETPALGPLDPAGQQPNGNLPKVGGRIRFTSENARFFCEKSHAKRRANRPQPAPTLEPVAEQSAQDFADRRLSRVRAQLDELDDLMASLARRRRPDTKKLKELAEATARLQVQEQQLAGRPGPGTLRPGTRIRDDQPRLMPPEGAQPLLGPRRAG